MAADRTAGRALDPATLAAQAQHFVDPATGSVVPAIDVSTHLRPRPRLRPGWRPQLQTGTTTPTYLQAESLLARLEGGAGAKLFASGMAAISAVFQTLRPGDHRGWVPRGQYFGTLKMLRQTIEPMGVAVTYVDASDIDAIAAAVRPGETRLVYVETPANPTWAVTDICGGGGGRPSRRRDPGGRLHGGDARSCPGRSSTAPMLVVHRRPSTFNGHSDVLAGAIVTAADDERWEQIGLQRALNGAVLGPFEAFLLLRGHADAVPQGRAGVGQGDGDRPPVRRRSAGAPGLLSGAGGLSRPRGRGAADDGWVRRDAVAAAWPVSGTPASAMLSKVGGLHPRHVVGWGGREPESSTAGRIEQRTATSPEDLVRLSIGIGRAAGDLIADLDRAPGPGSVGPLERRTRPPPVRHRAGDGLRGVLHAGRGIRRPFGQSVDSPLSGALGRPASATARHVDHDRRPRPRRPAPATPSGSVAGPRVRGGLAVPDVHAADLDSRPGRSAYPGSAVDRPMVLLPRRHRLLTNGRQRRFVTALRLD